MSEKEPVQTPHAHENGMCERCQKRRTYYQGGLGAFGLGGMLWTVAIAVGFLAVPYPSIEWVGWLFIALGLPFQLLAAVAIIQVKRIDRWNKLDRQRIREKYEEDL